MAISVRDQVKDSDFPDHPVCFCGDPMYLDEVGIEEGNWLVPSWTCRNRKCDRRLYAQMDAETLEVVDFGRDNLGDEQPRGRKPSPPSHPMEIVGSYRPPNFVLNTMLKERAMDDVARTCAYCGPDSDPQPRMALVRLPNGLFICGDHPSGSERDKMGKI